MESSLTLSHSATSEAARLGRLTTSKNRIPCTPYETPPLPTYETPKLESVSHVRNIKEDEGASHVRNISSSTTTVVPGAAAAAAQPPPEGFLEEENHGGHFEEKKIVQLDPTEKRRKLR
jgi:hypothetical protein